MPKMTDLFRLSAALDTLEEKVALEFPNKDALNEYLKDHPKADKSKHTVKVSPHSLRDSGQEHEKAGRHDQAALHYNEAANMFRKQNSPEAADSMAAKAKEQAKLYYEKKKKRDES